MSDLGTNEPTQAQIEHAHGTEIHTHGVIGAGLHSHPSIPGEPEFYALIPTEAELVEQKRRAAEGKRRAQATIDAIYRSAIARFRGSGGETE